MRLPVIPLSAAQTVLLVEDEELVRDSLNAALELYGYTVLPARSGAEAVQVCSQHSGPIHLLITDVIMPSMSGPELVNLIRALRPEIKVLFMSGYPDDIVAQLGVVGSKGSSFIQKPFTGSQLALKAKELSEITIANHA
ncbi:MAG TPA: response regulator [Candidatus Angelobacter sp.]|nr:response regulator [Candidatus Angelobacter sp.]